MPLLASDLLRRLDGLDIALRRPLTGALPGERRSRHKGQAVEFADYRRYVPGDDWRWIDWNLYARLHKLFVRLSQAEEELTLSLVVDRTASMGFGGKAQRAAELAAALGYVALRRHHAVTLSFVTRRVEARWRFRGHAGVRRLFEALEEPIPAAGAGDLDAAIRRWRATRPGSGVAVCISDWLEKGPASAGVARLGDERREGHAVHVLAREELDPETALSGELRLRDAEDGETAEVTMSSALAKRYRARLEAWRNELRTACRRRGVGYSFVASDEPIADAVLKTLRRTGPLA